MSKLTNIDFLFLLNQLPILKIVINTVERLTVDRRK